MILLVIIFEASVLQIVIFEIHILSILSLFSSKSTGISLTLRLNYRNFNFFLNQLQRQLQIIIANLLSVIEIYMLPLREHFLWPNSSHFLRSICTLICRAADEIGILFKLLLATWTVVQHLGSVFVAAMILSMIASSWNYFAIGIFKRGWWALEIMLLLLGRGKFGSWASPLDVCLNASGCANWSDVVLTFDSFQSTSASLWAEAIAMWNEHLILVILLIMLIRSIDCLNSSLSCSFDAISIIFWWICSDSNVLVEMVTLIVLGICQLKNV